MDSIFRVKAFCSCYFVLGSSTQSCSGYNTHLLVNASDLREIGGDWRDARSGLISLKITEPLSKASGSKEMVPRAFLPSKYIGTLCSTLGDRVPDRPARIPPYTTLHCR